MLGMALRAGPCAIQVPLRRVGILVAGVVGDTVGALVDVVVGCSGVSLLLLLLLLPFRGLPLFLLLFRLPFDLLVYAFLPVVVDFCVVFLVLLEDDDVS